MRFGAIDRPFKLRLTFVAAIVVFLASCEARNRTPAPSAETDRAVIAAVLADFSHWENAVFGRLEGVILVDAFSPANPQATPDGIRSVAPNITAQMTDDLVESFVDRNRSAVPIAPLLKRSEWARIRESPEPTWEMPKGVKATGSISLPGYSADESRALVQLHHSWSIHGAVVTYVLLKKNGAWRVVSRDQVVFL
jgi:hypothetical protein